MRKFCEALPADRLLQGNNYSIDDDLVKEKGHRKLVIPETGATLTYASSLIVLSHFVGCLVSVPHINAITMPNINSRTTTTSFRK